MLARSSYDWALVRVVPSVRRGECLNAGAIVHCRERGFLAARILLSRPRLQALWPSLDLDAVQRHLESIPAICLGGSESGPVGQLPMTDRFHWLVAPRSTVVQTSPVHVGLCTDPTQALDELIARYVAE